MARRRSPERQQRRVASSARRFFKRNKFGVAPKAERTWGGVVFASKGEMRRHKELEVLADAGVIRNLQRQYPVRLSELGGKALLTWVVDWTYVDDETVVFEDFCGAVTPLKRAKVRMAAALYPDVLVRVSRIVGRGKRSVIVVSDCPTGKIPKLPKPQR